jgi:hypothetical protein
MMFNQLHKHLYRRPRYLLFFFFGLSGPFFHTGYGEGADLFSTQSFHVGDSVQAVIPTDLNSRGWFELVVVSKTGVYPQEKRWITIFAAEASGQQYSATARQRWEVDPAAAILDMGDITSDPGEEIFYLTGSGIRYYYQKKDGNFSTTPRDLLSLPTIAVFPAAGSLPRGRLFGDWRRDGRKMLLLPQFDSLVFFDRNGDENWQKTEKAILVPRTLLSSDQVDDGAFRDFSLHAEFSLPRIFVEDFNGDGLADLLLTEQESLTVYLRQSDGDLAPSPSDTVVFPVRPSGKNGDTSLSFLLTPVDVNGDKFADAILTLTKGTGKFLEREIVIFLFLNRQIPADPFSARPDQIITVDGITTGVNLEDVNGDGKRDLLFTSIRLGFWNIFKNLISKQVDLNTSIYLLQNDNRYQTRPDFQQKTSYRIDLTHGIRFHGTWPTLGGDFTGDGRRDLLIARDGEITLYPKSQDGDLFSQALTQSGVFTSPYMHIVDLNGDGLDDILFYEKKRNARLSFLLNRGKWKDVRLLEKESRPSDAK